MNKDVKELWVRALLSGDYEQGQRRLAVRRGKGKWQHCCLGVLCELAVAEGETRAPLEASEVKMFGHDWQESDYLPRGVARWAGVGVAAQRDLTRLNDNGHSYEQIAGYIEENL